MGNRIISISRQFGSGGHEVAVKTADLLGIRVYERELIRLACEYGELSEKTLSPSDEKATNPYLFQTVHEGNHHVLRGKPTSEVLFALQSHEIRRIARHEECVFVGRCADYVLRDHPSVMNIYIYASYADRLANCVGPLHMEKSVAKKMIAGVDKARAAYHRYWAGYAANDPEHNHIIVNSALLEVEGTAQALAAIARVRFGADIALGEGREDHAPAAASQDV